MDDPWFPAQHPSVWNGSAFYNTFANTDSAARMSTFNQHAAALFTSGDWAGGPANGSSALFKLSWTLTPQPATVLARLACAWRAAGVRQRSPPCAQAGGRLAAGCS